MRILMINVVCGIRSTGRICTDIALSLEKQGHEVKIAYGRGIIPEIYRKYAVRIGSDLDVKIHGIKSRLFDDCGLGSKKSTEHFIEWVKKYDPDIIHLHNIHGYYINIEVLFNYLHTCGKKIVWTLHDCWAFTGHAAYCEIANCNRWSTGCNKCPKRKDYPAAFIDASKRNWKRKKELFTDLSSMILVTPSVWLADLVKRSYLKDYRTIVINNGVDIHRFKENDACSQNKFDTDNKTVILGVAAVWNERKGLNDFLEIRKKLDDRYTFILIGLNKKQISELPNGITGIEHTNSVDELVELYSLADVFINPTYEDNYPTTNLEAIACGTPVITYCTGGSGESAKFFGKVVNKGDIDTICDYIKSNDFKCNIKREQISIEKMVDKYINLYSSV